jgi:hypothetical protein
MFSVSANVNACHHQPFSCGPSQQRAVSNNASLDRILNFPVSSVNRLHGRSWCDMGCCQGSTLGSTHSDPPLCFSLHDFTCSNISALFPTFLRIEGVQVKLACAGLFSLPLNVLSCAKDILFLTSFGVESCHACQPISVSSAGVAKSAEGWKWTCR